MKIERRRLLHLAAGAAALSAAPRIVLGQTYPTRPVRLIVSIAAGGTQDTIARLMAQSLSERTGQQFIIENRPGAGGNIGTEMALRAAPDGYTLFLANTANAINATLYEKLNFNFIQDVAPIAIIGRVASLMEVNPSLPANTVSDFIAYAKANPGKINMASGGVGNVTQMQGELFKAMTGVNLVHVPYRGEALAITDLIGGQVQVLFGGVPPAIEHIRAGKLRALAVTTTTRLDLLPDTPTISEFVPGYEASPWYGVVAPKNTPAEISEKLSKEINAILLDPRFSAQCKELGLVPQAGSPADLAKLIADETEKWAKVVKLSGTKAE